MIQGMSYRLHIDLEAYNPANFFQAIRILPKEGDEVRSFEELGTGEQQILAISFAHAYAKAFRRGVILVIEEPESHLHPLAQKWLSRRIEQFCGEGLQVIITTHNPNLVSLECLEGIVLARKNQQGTTFTKQLTKEELWRFCIEHGANGQRMRVDNVVPFYSANTSPEILQGFFAKAVVLVEGITEAMALPQYMTSLGLDTTKLGVDFIPVFGKGNLARTWRLFRAYGLPVYVIFDNDNEDDRDERKRQDLCQTLGVEAATVINEANLRVEESFAVFGRDFETTLRQIFSEYETIEQSVRTFLGYEGTDTQACKPLVARETAKQLLAGLSGWDEPKKLRLATLKQLKDRINGLLTITT